LVGDAFKNSPVLGNPDNKPGINAHFDLGQCAVTYPGDPGCASDRYIIPANAIAVKGGDAIDETSFYCTGGLPACVVPNEFGLVFWKQGLAEVKHKYADPNRNLLFHYV